MIIKEVKNLPSFLLILFSFLLISNIYFAQGILRGVVTDTTNSEALPFANVFVSELNAGASTDTRGYFFIPAIPSDKIYTIIVSYIGYDKKEIPIKVLDGQITHVEVSLRPSSVELQTVEKVGRKIIEENATDIGLQRIAIKDLESLPKGVETDIFRALQYMPGVRTTSDVSARYYVRGSGSNQNLVLLDGVPIYNPFHAIGLFSAIDPEIINSIEFYKGGFTAEYGERISSVLSINTKDGNKNRYSANMSASLLTAKAFIEGPIPHGSFFIAGRKNYSGKILKKFLNNQSVPAEFYDFAFKLNYSNPEFVKGSKFTINGFISNDDILYNDLMRADYKWQNNLFGFRWFHVGDTPLFIDIGFSFTNFRGEIIPNLSNSKPQFNELSDITLDANFNYIYYSKNELTVGLHIKDVATKLSMQNSLGAVTNASPKGTNFVIFVKYKFLQYDNLGIDLGTRFALTKLAGEGGSGNSFEPRLSITYNLIPQITLKAATGFFRQDITTISDENEAVQLFEPWIIVPTYVDPPAAVHYTAGIDLDFTDNLAITIEAYYKDIQNMLAINQNKIRTSDPDLIAGTGQSYGMECSFRFTEGFFNFSAAYALAWAYKEIDNWVYHPTYDSRHTLNLNMELNLGDGWLASAAWNFNTGLPFTQFLGFYDKLSIPDPNNPRDIIDKTNPYSILGDINMGRMPDYHRLDLSITKKIQTEYVNLNLNVSLVNVYGRKNVFYFDRETGERINSLPFLPTATVRVEL